MNHNQKTEADYDRTAQDVIRGVYASDDAWLEAVRTDPNLMDELKYKVRIATKADPWKKERDCVLTVRKQHPTR